jgi:membrane-bound serine protease (ClpP class)
MDGFLQILSDPNVAYLLLTVGVIGLLAEFFHPGAILPGIAGSIALIMGFVGLGQLPFSWGGLALLALAAGLVVFELTTSASGVLVGAGIVAFVLGSLTLYSVPQAGTTKLIALNLWLVALMAGLMAGFCLYVLLNVRLARRRPITAGLEALLYKQAAVLTRLNPRGKVRFEGEVWTAELQDFPNPLELCYENSLSGEHTAQTQAVEAGKPVIITGLEGVILKVRALSGSEQTEWEKVGWN